MTKFHCDYTYNGKTVGSDSHKKGNGACSALVDNFNDSSTLDDQGASYNVSALYHSSKSGGGLCQLYFTKKDCATSDGFYSDADHAPVQTYSVKCKST